jgi:hypothetical protein
MSRYSLTPNKEGYKVDVGYDAHVDSYFLQVRMPNDRGDAQLVTWRGNGVVDFGNSGVITVPDDLLVALLADRDPAPEDGAEISQLTARPPNQLHIGFDLFG